MEHRWYQFWQERGYFTPDASLVTRHASLITHQRFCITIPPPNVTGELHMGHGLQHAVHDLIVRRRRMQGYNTLCLPGTDHASIGTSVKIENALREEGMSRWDLGREKYLERAWDWTRKYGGAILVQLRAMGCSYDWSRTRFTLDEAYTLAVLTAFVSFYEQGWIYRGRRVMNWCATCQTVVSDLEVQHRELPTSLWHIRYPAVMPSPTCSSTVGAATSIARGARAPFRAEVVPSSVTVATTRPETMLGDTALAVRPGDERYAGLVGGEFVLPLIGRRIPMVADHHVDPAFGTGVVKVTPAHDPIDFEIGQRHHLPAVQVIGPDGRMTAEAGEFAGLDLVTARQAVVEALQREGLLEKTEAYTHSVGHHDRCGSVLEPLLSEQWFMRMEELAGPARRAIREGRVRFTPARFAPMVLDWLENIRDWCLSRQLWWGHRIPVFTCEDCGVEFAAVDPPAACGACGAAAMRQDPDVLDTWFSSALWPFATLGWPGETADLAEFYPTDLMITGRDILYLWIARMVMMGEHFLEREPFREVMVHATVMTAEGKRMSKSLGTGVDPLELVALYGADATRFALASLVTENQDIRFKIDWREGGGAAASDTDTVARAEQCEAARNFCTKLWNISRFALLSLGATPPPLHSLSSLRRDGWETLELADRWILSRFAAASQGVNDALDCHALGEACWLLYHYVWDELADWYVELVKPRLRAPGGRDSRRAAEAREAGAVLLTVLEATLRLAHPFLPFITEEIWQALPGVRGCAAVGLGDSIMVAPYPGPLPELRDAEAEARMERVTEVTRAIRNLRAALRVPQGETVEVALSGGEGSPVEPQERLYIEQAARARLVAQAPAGSMLRASAAGLQIVMDLTDSVDLPAERTRLRKELGDIDGELERVRARLANPQFLERAPAEQVEKARRIESELLEKEATVRERLRLFEDGTQA